MSMSLLNFPLVIFVVSLLVLWLSVQVGAWARKFKFREYEKADLSMVINASLTLLALIIGFTFSMAVSRYDQRKNYEEEEANAIGTEYVRAGLLPAAEAAKVRAQLTEYLDQRLLFYTSRDTEELRRADKDATRLQNEMWSVVQNAAAAQPTPISALVVAGMNDVLNRQGYTQAAWWNRIPTGAWSLMAALAICCGFLVGYDSGRRRNMLISVLPFMLSMAFFLIADIDSPRRGVIRVAPHNLISLDDSLHHQ